MKRTPQELVKKLKEISKPFKSNLEKLFDNIKNGAFTEAQFELVDSILDSTISKEERMRNLISHYRSV